MSTSVDSSNSSSKAGGAGGPSGAGSVDKSTSAEDSARSSLRDEVSAKSDTDATKVADKVVGDADAFDAGAVQGTDKTKGTTATAEVPSTEPNPANRAAADAFRDEFHAIDDMDGDIRAEAEAMKQGDFRSANDRRADVLGRVAEHAQSIPDTAERNRFVRAIAPDAGLAAGKYSKKSPYGAYQKLDAIGKGVSPETGRLLANSALQYGPARDNLVPTGRPGSPVGDALTEARQKQTQRVGEAMAGTARTIIPGVDAAVNAAQGNYDAAAGSLGVDLMGGALVRGGKKVVTAVVGGMAMAPEQAEAGVLSKVSMRFGAREAVEVKARTGLVNGRTKTFDVEVPGTFKDGSKGSLRLADPRGKHNAVSGIPDGNLSRIAKALSRKGSHEFSATRKVGMFSDRYNSVEGQAELANEVMSKITPAQLAKVGREGGELTVELDRVVGLTPTRAGKVVPATTVRVMRNNDGGFHLVPMP